MSTIIAFNWVSRHTRRAVALAVLAFALCGCHAHRTSVAPSLSFTRLPEANSGGPDKVGLIEGRVTGAAPGDRIVVYAHSGVWWIQPTRVHPFTEIQPDLSWKNVTHLGTDYAALLVDGAYVPASRMDSIPSPGKGVRAVAVSSGKPGTPVVTKVIHFSGYDWAVRTAGSNRGGEPNAYDPANAWTDERGFLHLYMGQRNGRWTCAEVNLTRSFGYGTYRFVVQSTAHLPASAVVGMFTWDDIRSEDFRNELDIELSRWGDPTISNAQYVVQPFYAPENVSRFTAPAGTLAYTFRWAPGTVTFKTVRGAKDAGSAPTVSTHTFASGVPSPANEMVHINLYDFHHSRHPTVAPVEVVIEKFEYVP